MIARGALIKPWIFAEALGQVVDDSPEARVAIYREYVRLAKEHFGDDERGHTRLRPFLVWHLGLWCRHIPRQADGSYVPMQERAVFASPGSPLEGLLARPSPRCMRGSPTGSWPATRSGAADLPADIVADPPRRRARPAGAQETPAAG